MVVHILNKDIRQDTKLTKSKISNFGVKSSHFLLKCSSFIMRGRPFDSEGGGGGGAGTFWK